MHKPRPRVLVALVLAVALVAGALSMATAPVADPSALSVAQECQQALGYPARTAADRAWLNQCVHALRTPGPSGSPAPTATSPTATPTRTTPAPTTPPPTTTPPTPTPTPTATSGPAGWPTPASTGWRHTGVSLTLVTGILYARTPGQVIDSVEARDGIVVQANNVTIRRSLVEGSGSGYGAGIWIVAGVQGTVVEDVEVTSRPGADPNVESALVDRAITAQNTTGTVMRRVYAHRMIRGLEPGCDTVVEDSYVDDEVNPGGAHMSAVGTETCAEFRLTVNHNHVGLSPNKDASAALLYYPPQVGAYGTQHVTIAITNNYVTGGTYCLWLSSDPKMTGTITVAGNRFGTDYYPNCGLYGPTFTDQLPREGSATVSWSDNAFTTGRVVAGPA